VDSRDVYGCHTLVDVAVPEDEEVVTVCSILVKHRWKGRGTHTPTKRVVSVVILDCEPEVVAVAAAPLLKAVVVKLQERIISFTSVCCQSSQRFKTQERGTIVMSIISVIVCDTRLAGWNNCGCIRTRAEAVEISSIIVCLTITPFSKRHNAILELAKQLLFREAPKLTGHIYFGIGKAHRCCQYPV